MGQPNNTSITGTVDIDKPWTWPRYKKGMCDTCMAGCCTLIVEVRAPDLIRLGLTDEWEVAHCLNDLVKRLKKQHVIQRYCPKTGVFVLGRKRGSDCIFLDRNRRCTVYERRPAVCRSHPETVGPRIGHCPYMPI